MRLEATAKADEYKVWMTDDELKELRRSTMNPRDDLIIQLGDYVGLRAFEIPQIQPKHVKRTADGDHYRLRVTKEKDTTGSDGKPRDAYLPSDVESDIYRYQTPKVRHDRNNRLDWLGMTLPYLLVELRGFQLGKMHAPFSHEVDNSSSQPDLLWHLGHIPSYGGGKVVQRTCRILRFN